MTGRRARLVLLLALAGGAAHGEPGDMDPAAPARMEQQALPALAGRQQAAQARIEAARRYFAGELELEAAFPDLEGAPLDDPAWLAARGLALRQAAEARAAERVAPPPAGLGEADANRLSASITATCDAEDLADALEFRKRAAGPCRSWEMPRFRFYLCPLN